MHHRHRILDRDALHSPRLPVEIGPRQRRQDDRITPVQQMTAVEFRVDTDEHFELAHCNLGGLGVGRRNREVASERDQYLDAPVPDLLDTLDD